MTTHRSSSTCTTACDVRRGGGLACPIDFLLVPCRRALRWVGGFLYFLGTCRVEFTRMADGVVTTVNGAGRASGSGILAAVSCLGLAKPSILMRRCRFRRFFPRPVNRRRHCRACQPPRRLGLLAAACLFQGSAQAQSVVYRCPQGRVHQPHFRAEGSQRAWLQGLRWRIGVGDPVRATPTPRPALGGFRCGTCACRGARAQPGRQSASIPKTRRPATDARTILAAELKKDEEALAQCAPIQRRATGQARRRIKNHQSVPRPRGGHATAITRKEADIAALKREMAKNPN